MDKPKCQKAQLVLIKTCYVALVIQPVGSRVKQVFINGKDISDDNSASTGL